MLQLCGRRSIKGRKSPVRECLQAFPALFPLYSLLLFFFFFVNFSPTLYYLNTWNRLQTMKLFPPKISKKATLQKSVMSEGNSAQLPAVQFVSNKSQCFPWLHLGKHWDSLNYCFPQDQSYCHLKGTQHQLPKHIIWKRHIFPVFFPIFFHSKNVWNVIS